MPELPVNTIVIVVLCIIVLLAVAALLLGVWNSFKDQATMEVAKNNACQMLVNTGCTDSASIPIRNFDANRNGKVGDQETGSGISSWVYADNCYVQSTPPLPPISSGDNLATLCRCWYGIDTEVKCENLCGCS